MDKIRFPDLPSKFVEVCGVRLRVFTAGQIQIDRQTRMFKQLRDAGLSPEVDPMAFTWPLLASCTEPQIDFDEFQKIPHDGLNAWAEVAAELNPHWFAGVDPKN